MPDKPRMWSEKKLAWLTAGYVNGMRNVDIAPDGKRMVALLPAEARKAQRSNQVVFLLNFLDELRRKVPTGK